MRPFKILTGPNLILEKVCRPAFQIPEWLIPEMFRLLRYHKGFGLAAPQVGIDARFFITVWGDIFINPIITWHSEREILTHESCLSFPNTIGIKSRRVCIEICGHRYDGPEAVVIQHELDHLNGITIATGM